jgi:hypothetical protein
MTSSQATPRCRGVVVWEEPYDYLGLFYFRRGYLVVGQVREVPESDSERDEIFRRRKEFVWSVLRPGSPAMSCGRR